MDNHIDKPYVNTSAANFHYEPSLDFQPTDSALIQAFHSSLPSFAPTPLYDVAELAAQLGIGKLLIKTESSRLGLPAFKILGASWGIYRALCEKLGLDADPRVVGWERLKNEIGERKKTGERYVLFAATEGNHGRAVARTAGILGLCRADAGEVVVSESTVDDTGVVIYVPSRMYETTKKLIQSEGAKVVTVAGDYDAAVAESWEASKRLTGESGGSTVGIMVQDNAFEDYLIVPQWIVEGYATLLTEVDDQFGELQDARSGGKAITHVVTPIGVGSLGMAVVKWAKAKERKEKVRVITVEPETAACLNVSLRADSSITIDTRETIMSGMCCGTVSPTSWEPLRNGVDASATIGDWACHEAVLELRGRYGIESGPCGAGCLAGFRKLLSDDDARERLGLHKESVVVVLSTEGRREYPIPIQHHHGL